MIKEFNSKVLSVRDLTPTVKEIKLTVPEDFEFKAGRYVEVTIETNNEKFKTPYSIAVSPNEVKGKGFILLCVKKVDNGLGSNFMHDLKEGDEVKIVGPLGAFFIDENSESFNKDLVFIAAGTGMSTFRSMIPYLLESGFTHKLILLKGARNESEIIYDPEFEKLREKYSNFEFHNILSQPKDSEFENTGYVQDFLDKYVPKGISEFGGDFYLCGLSEMLNAVKGKLKEEGVSEDRIHIESYD